MEQKARQWFRSHLLSAVSLSQAMAHEAGKQRQHHLWIHLHQVVRQGVDAGTNLAGQRDSIPGREPRWAELATGAAEVATSTEIIKTKNSRTWRCPSCRPPASCPSPPASPSPTWRRRVRWRRSVQTRADWCWSAGPAQIGGEWRKNVKKCEKHPVVFSQPQTQTHTRTLKLLICVLFFFSVRVVLTQLRMMWSATFSPSPRSDKTITVYLGGNEPSNEHWTTWSSGKWISRQMAAGS